MDQLVFHFAGGSVQFHQQEGLGAAGVAGADKVVGCFDGEPVHDLHAGRHHAGGNDVGHRLAGALDAGEDGHDGARQFGDGQDAQGGFGGYAQTPFRAGE